MTQGITLSCHVHCWDVYLARSSGVNQEKVCHLLYMHFVLPSWEDRALSKYQLTPAYVSPYVDAIHIF